MSTKTFNNIRVCLYHSHFTSEIIYKISIVNDHDNTEIFIIEYIDLAEGYKFAYKLSGMLECDFTEYK